MRIISIMFLVFVSLNTNAQSLLKPGDNSINKNFIRNTHFEMAYYAVSGRQTLEVSSFDVEVKVNGKTISGRL